MKTDKPRIDTIYVDELYPRVIGNVNGFNTVKVYNENFTLIKSITDVYNKFSMNLDDVIQDSEAFVFTAIESGKTESDYSKILVKRTYLKPCHNK